MTERTEKGIVLTPDFAQMFRQFTREARIQTDALYRDMPEMDCAEMAEKRDALRSVQAIIAPLNIAVQAMTSTAQIQTLRDILDAMTKSIVNRADRLDNELGNNSQEYTLCYITQGREVVEAEFLAANRKEAFKTARRLAIESDIFHKPWFIRDHASNQLERD